MPTVNRNQARYRAYRMKRVSGSTKPGSAFRHIIAIAHVAPNNEYTLHATKGYRYRRLPRNRNALLDGLAQRLSEVIT